MTDDRFSYQNLKKKILKHLKDKHYKPLNTKNLLQNLEIPVEFQQVGEKALASLQEEGILHMKGHKWSVINQNRSKKNEPPRSKDLSSKEIFQGSIKIHPKGFGFVKTKETNRYREDIFIPRRLTEGAIDGDEVRIEVEPILTEKGPEGKVVSILQRKHTHLVGTIYRSGHSGSFEVYSLLLGLDKLISVPNDKKYKIGDKVEVLIHHWGHEKSGPQGRITKKLGTISDYSADISVSIHEFGLTEKFPSFVTKQAVKWGNQVSTKELKNRVDFSQIITFTIDPETAKDFDDALSITKDQKGNYHLGVHIADVAHYVPEGSKLDVEAFHRGNSTYFPGFCLPMLPPELSDNLCSLKPEVVRLTISVSMILDPEGELLSYQIDRSFIRSSKRFTYEEAKMVLDKKTSSPYEESLKLLVELCLLLKKKRYDRGSIDFSLPELIVLVDQKGKPYGTKRVEYDITHQLVEEFMLKANEVVAKHLVKQGKPVLFRIHEEPSNEDFSQFYTIAAVLGHPLSAKPSQKELQAFFEKVQATPYAQQLAVSFIRSLKAARYSPENCGHYGLALENYCHFTSPIRRYIDLVIQRLLFNEASPQLNYEQIAQHCSEKERISFKAESNVKLLKKLRLLDQWKTTKEKTSFNAFIVKVKPFGISFEIEELALEGFLHISELENDYFTFDEAHNALVGQSTKISHHLGKIIQVKPINIDLIILQVQWELAIPEKQRRPKKTKRRI